MLNGRARLWGYRGTRRLASMRLVGRGCWLGPDGRRCCGLRLREGGRPTRLDCINRPKATH
eukprot:808629-Prymnesium_polylepis.1